MEDRKSVLETTTPTDALGRLSARRKSSHVVLIVVAVLAFFGIIFFVSSLFTNTFQGSGHVRIPSVSK